MVHDRVGELPPSKMVIARLDSQELIGAAAAYLDAAMIAQLRDDVPTYQKYPKTLGISAWPYGLAWEPSNDPVANLRLARELVDLEIKRLGGDDA